MTRGRHICLPGGAAGRTGAAPAFKSFMATTAALGTKILVAGRCGYEGYWFSLDCPMISCAVKLMPQVGKELPTKKLSDCAGK
jgi:hypothetical protein